MNGKFPRLYTDYPRYWDLLESQYRDYAREAKWLNEVLDENSTNEVVDFSCGTGSSLSLLIAPKGARRNFFAADVGSQTIGLARDRVK
ncbi:MAG: hypothetical protein ACRDF4_10075, partial [Rhabdochlamydiaceae bacterium]